ncbi:MAG: P-II family nitrogen regulator [Bacteroidetes bacterium]|nr:P-II family nitrogen regulator [Bacteroidota bacterium]
MNTKKITAIIRRSLLQTVEQQLVDEGVDGLSLWRVKGYGEYLNTFGRDMMVEHMCLVIFAQANQVDRIVDLIREAATAHGTGDGIIAIQPVEDLVRIRDQESRKTAE